MGPLTQQPLSHRHPARASLGPACSSTRSAGRSPKAQVSSAAPSASTRAPTFVARAQRGEASGPTHPATPTRVTDVATFMVRCFEEQNPWTEVLRPHTTAEDLQIVRNMCREINPERWQEIFANFFTQVVEARRARPAALIERDRALPDDWFHEPFYYLYVQYFATEPGRETATFDQLRENLDYLDRLGFKNVYLLPHYESPMGDHGYDPSSYEPRESLGGRPAYERCMQEMVERGFRVVTDAPFNHVSVEHAWFQEAMVDDRKLEYFIQVNDWKKIGESNDGGDITSKYESASGDRSDLKVIFPDVDRVHYSTLERKGERVQLFRSFYPFQMDLNLRNPDVLNELFKVVGRELNEGVLGKRTDAIAHWLKRPGTANDGLPETHALQALFKSFMRHVAPKSVILPEAVRNLEETARYAGIETRVRGEKTASEGDALFCFPAQAALRRMNYFQTSAPFWEMAFQLPELPANARWLNLLEHHDETYLGYVQPESERYWMGRYIEDNGGRVYKNGLSAGGRYADCLQKDPGRIAAAMFSLYLAPGTPTVYYGLEVGLGNQREHAERMQAAQHRVLASLGVHIPFENAFDPRELQRGPLPSTRLAEAEAEHYLPLETVKRLNALRAERPSLASTRLTPIDNGHDGVLALVKLPPTPGADRPLLALANLTHEPKRVRMPVDQYREKMGAEPGSSLRDLLFGRTFATERVGDFVELDLAPREFLLSGGDGA